MGKHIGFITSWMDIESTSEVQELAPLQTITAGNENQSQLTPAHLELQFRIALTEKAISSKNFAKLEAKKKREFLEEYKWLISLNAQLGA